MEILFKIESVNNEEESPFDRQERISWWDQNKLRNARVLVIGAGAIGNETLKNLALLGIGNVLICDMDTISTSNLSRTVLFRKDDIGKLKAATAAERFKELNLEEASNVDYFNGDIVWDLGTGIYRYFDIVLGCLDNVETRFKVNRMCRMAEKPYIDAGINELAGSVSVFYPPTSACYECNASKEQYEAARLRYSCDDFKRKVIEQGRIPTVQIASAIISAIQVQEAVKILCNKNAAYGKKIFYQGSNHAFELIDLKINENCLAHVTYDDVIKTPLTNQLRVSEFLDYVSTPDKSGKNATIDFRGDRSFLASAKCRGCGKEMHFYKPPFRMTDYELLCDACKNIPDLEAVYDEKKYIREINMESDSHILNMTLDEVGIPKLHIIAVRDKDDNYKYYELSGDLKNLMPNISKSAEVNLLD